MKRVGRSCSLSRSLSFSSKTATGIFTKPPTANLFRKASSHCSKEYIFFLHQLRGKSNLIKDLRSNTENWSRIESKILYLIQLWYDAFILEESKYPYIINNYKTLRKENVIFPPRNVNEKSLLAIQTESPIFDNIETIAGKVYDI